MDVTDATARLEQVRGLLEDHAEDRQPMPLGVSHSWECHEIAEVAEALQRHADSLYVHA